MVSEFTDHEVNQVRESLAEHFNMDVELQLSECEVRRSKEGDGSSPCHSIFWYAHNCNFIVYKADENRYGAQFFFTPLEQYDTEYDDYSTLDQCVRSLLARFSDHDRNKFSE